MKNSDSILSQTISFLRFPLIVGVVFIHANFSNLMIDGVDVSQTEGFPVYQTISLLCSNIIARICVPLFFFISGFLFFYKSEFSLFMYLYKLKKRVHTLLVPYLFWNFLVIVLYFLVQSLFPGLTSGMNTPVSEYTLTDWVMAFWSVHADMPISGQFWFIRDLMVIVLLTPLVYYSIKYVRVFIVLLLGLFWFFDYWFSFVGFSITAFFFFTAGAWFSINKVDFVQIMRPWLYPASVLYIVLVSILLLYECNAYMLNMSIVIGIISIVAISSYSLERGVWTVNSFLSDASFFIFAYHSMLLLFCGKVLFKIIAPDSSILLLLIYLGSIAFVVFLGLGLYYFLRKKLPQFTSVITGGR